MLAFSIPFALVLAAIAPLPEPAPSPVPQPSGVARKIVVLPSDEPGRASSTELAGVAQLLRGSLRERAAEVLTAAEVRRRIGAVEANVPDLERAYAGAQAAYQADELDSAVRILGSVLADLDQLPESEEAHRLTMRAELRLAQAERARGRHDEAARAMERILALEPGFVVDPDQYAPSFRRAFDEARARVQLAGRSTLTIRSLGRPVTACVGGKSLGTTPVSVDLPPGRYRVRGAVPGAGAPLTPPVFVTVGGQPLAIDLDAPLAESLRLAPAPAIAAPAPQRDARAVAIGRWIGADEVVTVARSVEDGGAITATLHDVRRGARVREASAPVVSGALRPESVNALAAFLLQGDRTVPRIQLTAALDPTPAAPARWLRPAAYAAGVAALALGAVALLEVRAANDANAAASAMVRSDGALLPATDRAGYDAALNGAHASMRNAYVAAGGALVVAVTAGILGYRSADAGVPPVFGPAVRF